VEDAVTAGLEHAIDSIPAQQPRPDAPAFSAMVVDDHPLVREAMVTRLQAMGATEVVEAATVGEARARANMSGPASCACSTSACPTARAWTCWPTCAPPAGSAWSCCRPPTTPTACARLRRRRQGYLLKSASPVVVADGVRRVLDGGVYADPSVASLLAAGLRGSPTDTGVSDLSGREVEVIRLVADGQSNKQIGDALGLSALTVKSHLARIARKLGTGDRAEMVALAMRAGVIR
jgi:DNA-binding NarL/FixJ family response regulator